MLGHCIVSYQGRRHGSETSIQQHISPEPEGMSFSLSDFIVLFPDFVYGGNVENFRF